MINARKFIQRYESYYFKETYKKNDAFGIKGIKTTRMDDEEAIVDKLSKGIHDQDVIAWKMGSFKLGKDILPGRIIGSYGTYDMSEYLKKIDEKSSEISKIIKGAMEHFNNERNPLDAIIELSNAFDVIKACNKESRFGTVYMINSMFFLSKGEIPIYDVNVYRAIQALYLGKNPKDIIVSGAPAAKDSMGAMFRLIEYMYLLNQVFGAERTTKSEMDAKYEHIGYISRGLDRALWVYGQCTTIYNECDCDVR